jgi:hypothetical protein
MSVFASPRVRFLRTSAFLAAFLSISSLGFAGDEQPPRSAALTVVGRTVTLDRDHWQYWQVDYRFRNDGANTLVIPPANISAKVHGWVSNSRVAAHAMPRQSSVAASGATGFVGLADVIPASDESSHCRERMILQAWNADNGDAPPDPIAKAGARTLTLQELPTLELAPGAVAHVRIRLAHEHFLYGKYNALLGPRTVELELGSARFHDKLPLDRERRIARAASAWPPGPPADLRDTRVFLSAPDSLHLEAHTPGKQSHRFPEREVRYATRMRLRFWYLIATGSEGEYRARVAQYKDSPTSWKSLPDGEVELNLGVVGRWTRVERIFRTEPDATSLALDYRIVGADIGELWIDDVTLEPLGSDAEGP